MSANAPSILILDDDASVRQSLTAYFDDRGWKVFQAPSGEAALEIVGNEPLDAAIVDIRLDGMNGDAFMRNAVRMKPDLVFVVCTGSPDYLISENVKNLSGLSPRIFTKPVADMAAMEAEVGRLIRLRSDPGGSR